MQLHQSALWLGPKSPHADRETWGGGNLPTHLLGHCFSSGIMSCSDPNPNTVKANVVPQTHLLSQALSRLVARKAVTLLRAFFFGAFSEDFLHPG